MDRPRYLSAAPSGFAVNLTPDSGVRYLLDAATQEIIPKVHRVGTTVLSFSGNPPSSKVLSKLVGADHDVNRGTMETSQKYRFLLEATVDLLTKEIAADNKDHFTRSYLENRLGEIRGYLDDAGAEITKSQLKSTKNIVSNLSYAIDQNAGYDDHAAQFYKAAIGDLKDELELACEDR